MSRRVHGKTVYVFGAGASYHTGAPLLMDFLAVARTLYDRGVIKYRRGSFEEAFRWIERLKASSYFVDVDLDNIEHVYSIAEMQTQLGERNSKRLYASLKDVITMTLDKSIELTVKKGRIEHANKYMHLVNSVIASHQHRDGERGNIVDDVFITFNYDPVLDFALSSSELGVNYCLPAGSQEGVKLLKLHGSTNWSICSNCKKGRTDVRVHLPNSSYLLQALNPPLTNNIAGEKIEFNLFERIVASTKCSHCGAEDARESLVIPPTWSKRLVHASLKSVWNEIVRELQNAFQIVVVGYSMPTTDTFFQYLLTLGLRNNSALNRVVVVNPDTTTRTEERYKAVFSRSMSSRGRLFYEKMTFEEFMKEKFNTYQFM